MSMAAYNLVSANFCQVLILRGYGFKEPPKPVEPAKRGTYPEKGTHVSTNSLFVKTRPEVWILNRVISDN